MALAHGYALPFEALRRTGVLSQNTADATNRATADGATKEAAGGCLDARALEVQQRAVVQPSILVVPQLTRNGVVLNQLPDTRTNFIQNNTMVGATGSVRPNLWDIGSLPSGFTVSYSASGQTTAADGTLVDYIDVTVSGTALAAGFFNLRQTTSPSPVSGNLLFASGMTYTASVYLALLSGSLTGVATNVMALQEIANTTFVDNTPFAPVAGITSALTRFSGTRPIEATGGADRVSVRWGHSITSGTSYDYTVRIASPQLEKGSVATPVIRTASGFVTVDALGVARDGAPPDFTFTRATTATRVNASGLIESVASGVLRLDYPIGGGCPAALIEASGTNLVLNSEDTATNWTIGANTASGYVDVIGVSGNTVTASASGGIGSSVFVRRSLNTVLASGSTYTVSFLMRQTGAHTIGGYWIGIAGVGDVGGGFDVSGSFSNGAIYSAAGVTNRIRRVERWGTDVYRCSETFTMTASGTLDRILMGPVAAVNSTASVASGTQMSFAAPQIELGAFPTSFIPTTAASATRNADVCTVSGVSGYIGQTEGTLYAEVDVRNASTGVFRRLIDVTDGTNQNRIQIQINNNDSKVRISIFTAGSEVLLLSSLAYTGITKIALAYKNNDTTYYVNGSLVSGTTSITVPATNRIQLGSTFNSASFFNDRIRAAAIYTTRLSNDQLESITRLT